MIWDILLPLARSWWTVFVLLGVCASALPARAQQVQVIPPGQPTATPGAFAQGTSIVHKIQAATERMEMIVSTSRILTLDQKIPQAQVNNPEVLDLIPLSPTQVQVSAKKPGVTQVNLWGEDKRIFTIDVVVYGDPRELTLILKTQFPQSALNVVPVGSSVMISGYVDQQENIPRIVQISQEYYPKVINNMTISGVQQVLLHVKVMEVSRTKLRNLGFDFAKVTNGSLVTSGVSGLISSFAGATTGGAGSASAQTIGPGTVNLALFSGNSSFFAVLDALREDKLAKILAEPNLVTISGRPAYFLAGGELGYQTSSGLTGTNVEFKQYGTRVDVVPIVMGNGRIRLEVRPSVSEPDAANSVGGVPSLKTREVDTGVEMRAGQTLAVAGLVQQRIESSNRGLPWISEVPYLGAPFRTVKETVNEVELLILVTPELVDAMDASQVPPCGPGLNTTSPSDCELFLKGHMEVPKCCPHGSTAECPACNNVGGHDPMPSGAGHGGHVA